MEFEWDEAKREANLVKHGIDFDDAREMFTMPRETLPGNTIGGEQRFRAIGYVKGRLVAAIYTVRGERIRLISVRRARINERRIYHAARSG